MEVIKQRAALSGEVGPSILNNLTIRLSFRYILDARVVCKQQAEKRGSAKYVSTASHS